MKTKTTYICNECGYQSPKWMGKCPGCGEWNTLEETLVSAEKKTSAAKTGIATRGDVRVPKQINAIKPGFEKRYKTPYNRQCNHN